MPVFKHKAGTKANQNKPLGNVVKPSPGTPQGSLSNTVNKLAIKENQAIQRHKPC
jgi:hypothetical protein